MSPVTTAVLLVDTESENVMNGPIENAEYHTS